MKDLACQHNLPPNLQGTSQILCPRSTCTVRIKLTRSVSHSGTLGGIWTMAAYRILILSLALLSLWRWSVVFRRYHLLIILGKNSPGHLEKVKRLVGGLEQSVQELLLRRREHDGPLRSDFGSPCGSPELVRLVPGRDGWLQDPVSVSSWTAKPLPASAGKRSNDVPELCSCPSTTCSSVTGSCHMSTKWECAELVVTYREDGRCRTEEHTASRPRRSSSSEIRGVAFERDGP